MYWAAKFFPSLLGVGLDMFDDTLDERMTQPLLDCPLAPGVDDFLRLSLLLDGLGKLDQPLGGIESAIQ